MDISEPVEKNNQKKNILDEPASSEPKLEEIFQMTNPTLSSMDTSVAKASKTLNSMNISSGLVSFTPQNDFPNVGNPSIILKFTLKTVPTCKINLKPSQVEPSISK